MTWTEFPKWLEAIGFRYTPGTYNAEDYYVGGGYWFPQLPVHATRADFVPPPAPWVHVFLSSLEGEGPRVPIADVTTSFSSGTYIEDANAAQAAVERAMMDFDLASGAEPIVSLPFRREPARAASPTVRTTTRPPTEEERLARKTAARERALVESRARRAADEQAYKAEKMKRNPSDLAKNCTVCGRNYTRWQWNLLPLLGKQKIEADEETGEPAAEYEARNCSCGSTLYLDTVE